MIVARIKTTEQIIAELRRDRLRLVKDSPKPHVINVDAVLVFGQDRVFEFGGVGYRAPPLSYRTGLRLLVAANALEDLIEGGAEARTIQNAVRVSAICLRDAITPVWRMRRWTPWLKRLSKAEPSELLNLLRWLCMVPDGATYQPSTRTETHDYMDALAGFVLAFPMWCGTDGYPLSWAHYIYGNRHLSRAQVRADLRAASSARASQYADNDYKTYSAEMRSAAGW